MFFLFFLLFIPSFAHVQRFFNAQILKEGTICQGELWVKEGKIIEAQQKAEEEVDLNGRIVAPGFIDLQINGGFGYDFSLHPEQIEKVAQHLLQFGVTSFFPTLVSLSREQYREVLPKLQPSIFDGRRAANLGIHLEGPYFSEQYIGAHDPQYLPFAFESSNERYGSLEGVRIVTLAPELFEAEQIIRTLKEQKILIAVGHSNANYTEMKRAIGWGVDFCTHLFNAMKPYHHREPGIIGAALLEPQLPYTLILDGVHLARETLLLCWKCHPEGLILITDATSVLGLPDGEYRLGSMDIESINDWIYLKNTQTIAGSKLSLDRAVQFLYQTTRCSKAQALEAASLRPAKLAGIYPTKGALSIGSDADFILLSEDLEVKATYIQGDCVWRCAP